MRIVRTAEFVKLPAGTLFSFDLASRDEIPEIGIMMIKGDYEVPKPLDEGNHDTFSYAMIGGMQFIDRNNEAIEDMLGNMCENGASFPQAFPSGDKDFLVCRSDPNQFFLVWEDADLRALETFISGLVKSLPPQPLTQATKPGSDLATEGKFHGHVDDWLDQCAYDIARDKELQYAHFVLSHFRKAAWEKNAHQKFMHDHLLFVDYEGKTWRVTGASRFGDIWLAKDLNRDAGYDLRVDFDLNKLTNWRSTPSKDRTTGRHYVCIGTVDMEVSAGKSIIATKKDEVEIKAGDKIYIRTK